jgi:hypothetical protein
MMPVPRAPGRFRPIPALLCIIPLLLGSSAATVERGVDAETGLRSWEWREAGVVLRLVQRLPDQTWAFFQARGFSSATADRIADACIFQTIFRNQSARPLGYSLDDWRVLHRGERASLMTRERWDAGWQEGEASQAARIALRWSLLPTRQLFEPGDYNWGMIGYGLPPGEAFDLELVLRLGDQQMTRTIEGIVCAPDREAG